MSAGEALAHPVRRPGPASLEKDPLERVWPKEETDGMGESVLSMSINRGRAGDWQLEGVERDAVGQRRKSYTSSLMRRALWVRARRTSDSRVLSDMLWPQGLEKVGTRYIM